MLFLVGQGPFVFNSCSPQIVPLLKGKVSLFIPEVGLILHRSLVICSFVQMVPCHSPIPCPLSSHRVFTSLGDLSPTKPPRYCVSTEQSLSAVKLPGYGVSSLSKDHSRVAIGAALLEASHAVFPDRAIILGGHDRGARVCHRLAVTHAHPPKEAAQLHSYKLLGVVLLDIVPTLIQWQVFANPIASVAYSHWAFLPSPNAPDIIEAYGGDRYCHDNLSRVAGPSPSAIKACQSNDAWKVYESLNSKRECIEGACGD